jgi:serine/threonine-protein kinase
MTEPASFVGRQLGAYRILSPLGAGGMGEVYRAYDEKLQRAAAVKVLRSADAPDPAANARLLREARAAAALNHPNICTVYEVGEVDGTSYIAMELVDGEALSQVIPAGAGLPAERLADHAHQIADALAHAHEHGVLHRDLKTANIVITKTGRAKVLDFGLAKRVTTDADVMTTTGGATVAGTVMGTPAYMAPEQLRGAATDARTDVWALGVVLYEMASGERPFAGQTPYELSSAVLNDQPRPLPNHVSRDLQTIVTRCLAKDPNERFQSAAEVVAALDGGEAAAFLPRARERKAVTAGNRRPAILVGLVLLLGLVAVLLNVRNWGASRPPLFDSIAVLPFRIASGGPDQEYLGAGIQQALTSELAQMPGLMKVVATASTRRLDPSKLTLAEIGRTLGVRALVTGTIARSGDRVQVSTQLLEAASEREVWGDTYDREATAMIDVQNGVVTAIAAAIELRLRPEDRVRIASRAAIKPATYELYLRGMHLLERPAEERDPAGGIKYLQQAVDNDPADPHAYAGLAKGYATLGHSPAAPEDAWIRARSAADRALTLAPELADAHAVMGDVKLYYEWDWAGAERAFRKANELNPNLAMNHYHYAWYLFLVDRLDEAIREHERARDLDPLTALHTFWLADLYRAAGRYDDSIATAKKGLEINPSAAAAWSVLSHTYSDMNRHDDAIAAARRAVELGPPQTFALGVAYSRAGQHGEAQAIRQKLESRPPTSYNMWARTYLYLFMNDADAFFEAIAYEPHHAYVPWVRTEPVLDRFRDDPRYAQLMARFKLPVPAPRAAR